MMNLKAELKLKTYRLCSPSSVLLNETQSAPLYANAPRRFFFCLSFLLSFLLFLNVSFPCSYSGGKIFFLFFYSQQWGKSSRLSVCSETAAALKKKKGKKAHRRVELLKAKDWNSSVSVMNTCRQVEGFFFFFSAGTREWTLTLHVLDTCLWRFLRIRAYIRGKKWWQRIGAPASLLAAPWRYTETDNYLSMEKA